MALERRWPRNLTRREERSARGGKSAWLKRHSHPILNERLRQCALERGEVEESRKGVVGQAFVFFRLLPVIPLQMGCGIRETAHLLSLAL